MFSWQLVDFVSDMGGQLGLWIGFSVITVAEFLELMLLICHAIIRKCSRPGKSKSFSVHNKRTELQEFQTTRI